MLLRLVATVTVALWLPLSAAASGLVLLIANENHETLRTARGVANLAPLVRAFDAAGFDTDQATDLSAPAMRVALEALDARIERERPERVVILFSGYLLHSDQGVWLMGTETRTPGIANIDATGVRLETVLAIAGRIQGGAVVAIADMGFPVRPGTGLQAGLPHVLNVPQGVSVIRGPAPQVSLVLHSLVHPGTNLRQAVSQTRQVQIEGFDPPFLTFLPEGHQPARAADRRAWAEAAEDDSADAYRAYLALYPQGLYADEARAAIERLENTPERIEAALNLTRDERRAIQRDLTLLGYDTRGIDGIFGAGTRNAIRGWQGRNGVAQTGFLDRDQIFQLAAQGARRAAELEAEARERQAEIERQDRAYWRDTGAGRDEAGLRAYLDRYPSGLFSSIARERLDEIEAERRRAEEARDRAAWDIAWRADTVDAYRRYLREFPDGLFADEAEDRIDAMMRPGRPGRPGGPGDRLDLDAARAEEDALRLPRFTRVIVEQRLAALGYDPGPADGVFDQQFRRALRRYQRDLDVPATGYLTQPVVARLLAEGFLRIFD